MTFTAVTSPKQLHNTIQVTGPYAIKDIQCIILDSMGNEVNRMTLDTNTYTNGYNGQYDWAGGTSGTTYKSKWVFKYKSSGSDPWTDYTTSTNSGVVFP